METIHIAVFGDTHGHLRLLLQLCRLWQLEHQVHLDGVLQCGDFGYFPAISRLDKATKRFAERDPEELGFANYFAKGAGVEVKQDSLVDVILADDFGELDCLRPDIFFCHGNHEDFVLLEDAVGGHPLMPIDRFERFVFQMSGTVTEVAGQRVAALGGGPELPGENDWPLIGKSVSATAARKLKRTEFDILMCHGAPRGIGSESDQWGSTWIREVVDRVQPHYCFFAHHRQQIDPITVGRTQCFWHNDVNFQPDRHRNLTGPMEPNCMGILEVAPDGTTSYSYVEEPWFRGLTGVNWQHF